MTSLNPAMLEVDGRVWLAEDPRLILIHVVLDNAIDKLDIVQHLISDGKRSDLHNDTIRAILEQRQYLEHEYQKRMLSRASIQDWNRKKIAEDAQATQSLIQQLRSVDQTMQKNVHSERQASTANVQKMKREKTRALNIIQKAVKELEETGRCESLAAVLADDMRYQNQLEESLALIKQLTDGNTRLEQLIKDEAMQFQELQSKMTQIQALKTELAQLHGPVEIEQNLAEMESRARIRTQTRLVQKQMNDTTKIVDDVQHDFHTQTKAHEFAEIYFKRKLEMAEAQLAEWLRRRHDEETQSQRRLEQIRSDREAQLVEMQTLKETISKEQTARDLRFEMERKQAELQRIRLHAAVLIQARVRGFLVRNGIKKSKSGSKKSKKGGKSKKKK